MRKYGAAYMMAIAMVLLLASPLKNLMVRARRMQTKILSETLVGTRNKT